MALGLRGEIRQLRSQLDRRHRFTDIAVRFRVYARNDRGRPAPTARVSLVYGGKWDVWSQSFIGPADDVLEIPCTAEQFEMAICDASIIEGSGGRGSGKSEGGVLWTVRHVAELPGERGQVVAPTHDIVKIDWSKLLAQIPPHWLRPGNTGIRRSTRELVFVHGHEIRFRSADNPDSLRSWGGSYSWNDEDQDITTEANDIIWPSLRCSPRPQLCRTLTPKAGEPLERHQALISELEDDHKAKRAPNASMFVFDSYSNCFISHEVFDLARKRMDPRRYRQEIQADWSAVLAEDIPFVFPGFDRDRNTVVLPVDEPEDITRVYTKRKLGVPANYIVGIDYNFAYPNYAVVWKVLAPNNWLAVDIVRTEPGMGQSHAGFLAKALKDRGYANSIIIDDATEQFKNRGVSCTQLLRGAGFQVFHQSRNPLITGRINATLAKLTPLIGRPTLFIGLPQCEELAEAMEKIVWDSTGKKMDKKAGLDHIIDAATYPVAWCEPPTLAWSRYKLKTVANAR